MLIQKMTQGRDETIDFVKGIAILAIMLCHASQVIPELSPYFQIIFGFGQIGCQVFFFFTGYLMTKKQYYSEENPRILGFILHKVCGGGTSSLVLNNFT